MKKAVCKFQPFCKKQAIYFLDDEKIVASLDATDFENPVDFSVLVCMLGKEKCEEFVLYGKENYLSKYKQAIELRYNRIYSKKLLITIKEKKNEAFN